MISILNVFLNCTHDVTKHPGPAWTGAGCAFDVAAGLSMLAFAPKAWETKWRWAPTRVTACACEIALVPQFSHFSPAALPYTVLHIKRFAYLGFSSCSFYINPCSACDGACLSACYWIVEDRVCRNGHTGFALCVHHLWIFTFLTLFWLRQGRNWRIKIN